MSDAELKWLPIEPTPFDLEFIARQEAFYRELLTAFALTSEEIGSLNANLARAERREEMYRKRVRQWTHNAWKSS